MFFPKKPLYHGFLLQHVENYVYLSVVTGERRDVRVKDEVLAGEMDAPHPSRQAHRAYEVHVDVRVESARSRTALHADQQSLRVLRLAQVLDQLLHECVHEDTVFGLQRNQISNLFSTQPSTKYLIRRRMLHACSFKFCLI